MPPDFKAFYLRHCRAIYRVCFAFLKNASPVQGELLAVRLTEGLPPKTMVVVLSRLKASRCLLQRHKLYVSPARGYFSMKKSNQKSLGEDPETPTRRYTPPGNTSYSRSGIRRRL